MKREFRIDSIFTVKSQKGYRAIVSLLEAGQKLIAEKGLAGMAVSDLCKLAGVNRTSFYAYFESPEHFIDVFAQLEHEQFEEEYYDLYGVRSEEADPGVERLIRCLALYAHRATSSFEWSQSMKELCQSHEQTACQITVNLEEDMLAGIEAGDVNMPKEDVETFTKLLLTASTIPSRYLIQSDDPLGRAKVLIFMLVSAGQLVDLEQAKRYIDDSFEYIAEAKIKAQND